jgi:hypothetical protein
MENARPRGHGRITIILSGWNPRYFMMRQWSGQRIPPRLRIVHSKRQTITPPNDPSAGSSAPGAQVPMENARPRGHGSGWHRITIILSGWNPRYFMMRWWYGQRVPPRLRVVHRSRGGTRCPYHHRIIKYRGFQPERIIVILCHPQRSDYWTSERRYPIEVLR